MEDSIKGHLFFDVVAWVFISGITLLSVLKLIGINSPSIFDKLSFFAICYVLIWLARRVSILFKEIRKFEPFQIATIKEINKIKINNERKKDKRR